jgi:hypothetical protein
MRDGLEIWTAAQGGTKSGCDRSANVMRLYALSAMLARAESAVLTGDNLTATRHLRELLSHGDELIALLNSDAPDKPALVAA